MFSIRRCDANSRWSYILIICWSLWCHQHPFLDFILSSKCPLRNWQCWWIVCFAFIGRVTLRVNIGSVDVYKLLLDMHRSIAEYQCILPYLVIDEVPQVKIVSQGKGTRLRRVDACRHLLPCPELRCHLVQSSTFVDCWYQSTLFSWYWSHLCLTITV